MKKPIKLEVDNSLDNDKFGGGLPPGGYHMLEMRVSNLESDMRQVRNDLNDIKVELAKISAKLDSKIDYKWLTVYVLGIVAVIMRSEIAAYLNSLSAS